jgi:hypothetical protein
MDNGYPADISIYFYFYQSLDSIKYLQANFISSKVITPDSQIVISNSKLDVLSNGELL